MWVEAGGVEGGDGRRATNRRTYGPFAGPRVRSTLPEGPPRRPTLRVDTEEVSMSPGGPERCPTNATIGRPDLHRFIGVARYVGGR